jgi:hypothetical protein
MDIFQEEKKSNHPIQSNCCDYFTNFVLRFVVENKRAWCRGLNIFQVFSWNKLYVYKVYINNSDLICIIIMLMIKFTDNTKVISTILSH